MLDDVIKRELDSIVGAENVLTDEESRASYSRDATGWVGVPDAVVRPRDTEQVAGLVALAYENSIPVTPRGAGTGLRGGSVPAGAGIVLSMERMNAAPRVHKQDLYAEVAPGVVTGEFQTLVESMGLFYPPDPASRAVCTIGGNVAECASGLRGLKYGTTRRYVLGLETVTPDGGVVFTGARTVKSVAGYDITRLMVGSEGTLGVITSAVLRLLPLPQSRLALSAAFSDIRTACEAASRMMGSGLTPATLEIMDGVCVHAVSGFLQERQTGEVLLLAEFDGAPSVCAESLERASGILRDEFRADVESGLESGEGEGLLRARREILPALGRLRPTILMETVAVPVSKLPAMAGEIVRLGAKHNVQLALFGHAGAGSIHTAFLTDSKDREEMSRVKSAVSEMKQACADLEGNMSGERGIGLDTAPYVKLEVGQSGYDVMRSFKDSLDPRGIMNPGKMFFES